MKRALQSLYLGAALLFAGVTLAQAVTGELRISVTPAGELSIDHQPPEQGSNFTRTVPAEKDLLLKVSKPGYETEYRTVRVGANAIKELSFTLTRQEIPVLFRANVPATLLLDGAVLGETPCYHFFKAPRIYQIEVEAEGYQAQKFHLNLTNGKPQVKTFELLSNSGTLVVTSEPEGAQVLLNGIVRGVTPCTLTKLREETYTLTLKKTSYHEATQTLKIMAGDVAEVNVPLEQLAATLKVTSTPAEANVYVDEKFRGKTPLTLKTLTAGTHHLRVRKEGYSEENRTLTVSAGGTFAETFSLEVILGTLAVLTEPATVTVYNGYDALFTTEPKQPNDYRSARKTHALAPGKYSLTFKANGYATETHEVTIAPNQTTSLEVKMTFKPNFKVRTTTGTYAGVWVSNEENGDIRIETQPGIIKRIPSATILGKGPIVE